MSNLNPGEVDTIYVNPSDRFIVSLIVGYAEEDLGFRVKADASEGTEAESMATPQEAARWALDLARDSAASGTVWCVFDRKTGRSHRFEQGEFDPEMEEVGND